MDGELFADQPLGEKLIKKGFWLYVFTLFIGPAGYFIRVLVSNSISVADVGIIYSIMGLIGILSAYHDLGLTEALQYHLPKYWITKKYNAFKTSIYLTLIIQAITGIIIAFLLFFGADYLAIHYFHSPEASNIIKIFCLYFLGINFFNMLYSIYIAFQDIIQYKLIEFIRMYATLGFTFSFFLLGILNITNFTWAWITGLGVSLCISGILFLKKYRHTITKGTLERDTILFKKQIKYAFRVFIGTNVTLLLAQIDQQIVIYFLGAEAAGYYTNYLSLIFSFSVIVVPIFGYIFPLTTELMTKNQHEKVDQLKKILYKYLSLFAISISGLFLIFGKEISIIFFGKKFMYSGQLLTYSSVFLIFYVLFSINFGFLAGMGKVKERAKIIFIALITNIVLNLVFIQFWGMVGVVTATMISWMMLFYLSHRFINKGKKINFDGKYILKNIIVIAILSTILYYFKDKIFVMDDKYRYVNLMYLILISVGYYICILTLNYKSILLIKKEIDFFKKIK